RVVALDGADQAEEAVRDQVVVVDVRRQSRAEPPGHVLHERRVRQDQAVAEPFRARVRAVLPPESLGVFGLRHRCRRIRSLSAYLSARAAIVASQMASAAAAAATTIRLACPASLESAAYATPANATASTANSVPSARRWLIAERMAENPRLESST